MAIKHDTSQHHSSQNNSLTVLSHSIRRQGDFYSLSDLHAAAGGRLEHHPDRYFESPLGRVWVGMVGDDGGNAGEEGRAQRALLHEGFGVRAVAEAYSLWVGSGFAVAVLRAFGAQAYAVEFSGRPATRYDLAYVKDLRWDDTRPGDVAWWEFEGQNGLSAAEAAELGRGFFEQTRQLAQHNPNDAELVLKQCLLRLMEPGFPDQGWSGRGFRYCEMVFCEWLSRAAVAWMASSGGQALPDYPGDA